MTKSSRIHNLYRNELTQCYLRICFIIVVLLSFLAMDFFGKPIENKLAYGPVIGYLLWIFCYYVLIRLKPQFFQTTRISLMMLWDISATALTMYLVGPFSAVFVAVFLWYIIGFGMRFGLSFAVAGTVATTVAWISLALTSPYWKSQPYNVIGWQIAFIIIPIYYFLLVKRLHISLQELNIALLKTEKIANRDHLTRLSNRNHFNIQAENLLKQNQEMALFLIDLDGFKSVNDIHGHEAGDKLLVTIANTLKNCCDTNCILGRLGGDEFIIATTDTSPGEVRRLADQILYEVAEASSVFGKITASIGICFCPGDASDLSYGKSLADTAMYSAKKLGKNRYCFSSKDSAEKTEQIFIENDVPSNMAPDTVLLNSSS